MFRAPTLEPPPSDDLGAPYLLLDHLEALLWRAREADYPPPWVLGGHLLEAVFSHRVIARDHKAPQFYVVLRPHLSVRTALWSSISFIVQPPGRLKSADEEPVRRTPEDIERYTRKKPSEGITRRE